MHERELYAAQGFGQAVGLGARPALLVVDFVVGFTDPALYGGGNILDAVARTRELLAVFRAHGHPVAFTRIVYADDGGDAGMFCRKAAGLDRLTEQVPASQIVPALAPLPGELVVRKTQPSAFFGTMLAPWLLGRGVDTVVVTGCTTSGCVRASVVDAMSHNFRTIVATDGVGDRAAGPHEASLFDMGQKYADLMRCEEIALVVRGLQRA
ncbi:MAG: isochorismatase family protein [Gammaproteobacteria bacterium]